MSGHIPNVYRPLAPGGPRGPLRWIDDVTGVLPQAVYAFYGVKEVRGVPTGIGDEPTPEQLELVREYAEYYIKAPCWHTDPDGLFADLLHEIRAIKNYVYPIKRQALLSWLEKALEVGIDPF